MDKDYDFGASPKPRLAGSLKEKKAKGTGSRVVRDKVSSVQAKTEPTYDEPQRAHHPPPKRYVSPKKHVHNDDEDDYGDDDFEDYGDDFEDEFEEEPTPAPAKQSSVPSSMNKDKVNDAAKPDPQEARAESKTPPANEVQKESTHRTKSSGSRNTAPSSSVPKYKREEMNRENRPKFGAMSMSMNGSMFGGGFKAKRLRQLMESGVMDLQEEKFTILNLPSSSHMEVYQRQLRAQHAMLRQFGVPAEEESRSVEVATDDLVMQDKSVQFCYGDDTRLLNTMDVIQRRKQAVENGVRLSEADSIMTQLNQDQGGTSAAMEGEEGGTTRLASFLQRASQVCERLLEEDEIRAHGRKHIDRSSTHSSLFDDIATKWTELGSGSSGANELVRTREVNSVSFSRLQPHLLVTTHPYESTTGAEDDDLLPFKGLSCVWDSTSATSPLLVLSSLGNPTCCCFSSVQTFLLIGGTAEGTLHLWDLRESSSIHKDRDAVDLGIERGIRKPCYSTVPLSASAVDNGHGGSESSSLDVLLDLDQHASVITHVEPIGDSDGSVSGVAASQFASLDESGMVCLWVTSSKNSSGEGSVGLSPWGRVVLVMTRALHVGGTQSPSASLYVDAPSVLASVPGDVSTLLAAGPEGSVSKVVRFGNAPAPYELDRSEQGDARLEMQFEPRSSSRGGNVSEDVHFHADVTCITVQKRTDDQGAQLVLVGRADGTVDLFRMDVASPIHSWTFPIANRNGPATEKPNTKGKPVGITSVIWLPNKFSAFIVVDNQSNCYSFDLLLDPHKPLTVENLAGGISGYGNLKTNTKGKKSHLATDLSLCRPGSTVAYMAMCVNGTVFVRSLRDGWLRGNKEDAQRLMDAMPTWIGRTAERKNVISFVQEGMQAGGGIRS